MDYESPEILATYVEDELVAEAAVCTCYCIKRPDRAVIPVSIAPAEGLRARRRGVHVRTPPAPSGPHRIASTSAGGGVRETPLAGSPALDTPGTDADNRLTRKYRPRRRPAPPSRR